MSFCLLLTNSGITLPSKEAQVANIQSVYKAAKLDFDQTGYVECHGTGTQAGDWRELKAISETLGSARPKGDPIYVGSVKPNIGHLEGAAGVAGMIKGILMLEHGKIPPHINFETPNPDIAFDDWRVKVRVFQSLLDTILTLIGHSKTHRLASRWRATNQHQLLRIRWH